MMPPSGSCPQRKFHAAGESESSGRLAQRLGGESDRRHREGAPQIDDNVRAPVHDYPAVGMFQKQWGAVLNLDSKIDKIINFDAEAKRSRHKNTEAIPCYLLAAYGCTRRKKCSTDLRPMRSSDAGSLI
jgi:hypothetical protein